MFLRFLLLSCVLLSGVLAAPGSFEERPERVALPRNFLFQAGRITTGRRQPGIPQLRCVSGNCSEDISQVLCTNMQPDRDFDPTWDCEVVSPAHNVNRHPPLRFATADVACEGYWGADDPKILQGSCGLEYSLPAVTQTFSEPLPRPRPSPRHIDTQPPWTVWDAILFMLVICAVVFVIVCAIHECASHARAHAVPAPVPVPVPAPVPAPPPAACHRCYHAHCSCWPWGWGWGWDWGWGSNSRTTNNYYSAPATAPAVPSGSSGGGVRGGGGGGSSGGSSGGGWFGKSGGFASTRRR